MEQVPPASRSVRFGTFEVDLRAGELRQTASSLTSSSRQGTFGCWIMRIATTRYLPRCGDGSSHAKLLSGFTTGHRLLAEVTPKLGTFHDNFEWRDPLPELGDWIQFAGQVGTAPRDEPSHAESRTSSPQRYSDGEFAFLH